MTPMQPDEPVDPLQDGYLPGKHPDAVPGPVVVQCPMCGADVSMYESELSTLPAHHSPSDALVHDRNVDLPYAQRTFVRTCEVSHHTMKDAIGTARDREERTRPGRYQPNHP